MPYDKSIGNKGLAEGRGIEAVLGMDGVVLYQVVVYMI